jgi:hypothetical protein
MTTITAWPLASRSRIVHTYKPGGVPSAEAPFRTLRKHKWASSGVRVSRRVRHHLSGQMTIFSSLNLESARLARHGNAPVAMLVAQAAADLESGTEFTQLQRLLSELPFPDAERLVDGVFPANAPAGLLEVIAAVARQTEQVRASHLPSSALTEVFAGQVTELHDAYVLLARVNGPSALVPRWMAAAARRDTVGALLSLVTDKFDDASALVEALPAIDTEDCGADEPQAFSPFGRGDPRALSLTAADERLLAGKPEPLRVLVPVTIDA